MANDGVPSGTAGATPKGRFPGVSAGTTAIGKSPARKRYGSVTSRVDSGRHRPTSPQKLPSQYPSKSPARPSTGSGEGYKNDSVLSALGNARVFLRVRPSAASSNDVTKELSFENEEVVVEPKQQPNASLLYIEGKDTVVMKDRMSGVERRYSANRVFGDSDSTSSLFDSIVKPMVKDMVSEGFSNSIVVSGGDQTGKTHTVFGDLIEEAKRVDNVTDTALAELLVRDVFSMVAEKEKEDSAGHKYRVSITLLDLYQENMRDLFEDVEVPGVGDSIVSRRIDRKGRNNCYDLFDTEIPLPFYTQLEVADVETAMSCIQTGLKERTFIQVVNPEMPDQIVNLTSHVILRVILVDRDWSSGSEMLSHITLFDLGNDKRAKEGMFHLEKKMRNEWKSIDDYDAEYSEIVHRSSAAHDGVALDGSAYVLFTPAYLSDPLFAQLCDILNMNAVRATDVSFAKAQTPRQSTPLRPATTPGSAMRSSFKETKFYSNALSLLALEKCFHILCHPPTQGTPMRRPMSFTPKPERPSLYIPYRDSRLTRLMKDALYGRSYITVIGTISPDSDPHGETRNTLEMANELFDGICRQAEKNGTPVEGSRGKHSGLARVRIRQSGEDGDLNRVEAQLHFANKEIDLLKQQAAAGGENAKVLSQYAARRTQHSRALEKVGCNAVLLPDGNLENVHEGDELQLSYTLPTDHDGVEGFVRHSPFPELPIKFELPPGHWEIVRVTRDEQGEVSCEDVVAIKDDSWEPLSKWVYELGPDDCGHTIRMRFCAPEWPVEMWPQWEALGGFAIKSASPTIAGELVVEAIGDGDIGVGTIMRFPYKYVGGTEGPSELKVSRGDLDNVVCTVRKSPNVPLTYTVTAPDVGQHLHFQVTPVDSDGVPGETSAHASVEIPFDAAAVGLKQTPEILFNGNARAGEVMAVAISAMAPEEAQRLNYRFSLDGSESPIKFSKDQYVVLNDEHVGKPLTAEAIDFNGTVVATAKLGTPVLAADPELEKLYGESLDSVVGSEDGLVLRGRGCVGGIVAADLDEDRIPSDLQGSDVMYAFVIGDRDVDDEEFHVGQDSHAQIYEIKPEDAGRTLTVEARSKTGELLAVARLKNPIFAVGDDAPEDSARVRSVPQSPAVSAPVTPCLVEVIGNAEENGVLIADVEHAPVGVSLGALRYRFSTMNNAEPVQFSERAYLKLTPELVGKTIAVDVIGPSGGTIGKGVASSAVARKGGKKMLSRFTSIGSAPAGSVSSVATVNNSVSNTEVNNNTVTNNVVNNNSVTNNVVNNNVANNTVNNNVANTSNTVANSSSTTNVSNVTQQIIMQGGAAASSPSGCTVSVLGRPMSKDVVFANIENVPVGVHPSEVQYRFVVSERPGPFPLSAKPFYTLDDRDCGSSVSVEAVGPNGETLAVGFLQGKIMPSSEVDEADATADNAGGAEANSAADDFCGVKILGRPLVSDIVFADIRKPPSFVHPSTLRYRYFISDSKQALQFGERAYFKLRNEHLGETLRVEVVAPNDAVLGTAEMGPIYWPSLPYVSDAVVSVSDGKLFAHFTPEGGCDPKLCKYQWYRRVPNTGNAKTATSFSIVLIPGAFHRRYSRSVDDIDCDVFYRVTPIRMTEDSDHCVGETVESEYARIVLDGTLQYLVSNSLAEGETQFVLDLLRPNPNILNKFVKLPEGSTLPGVTLNLTRSGFSVSVFKKMVIKERKWSPDLEINIDTYSTSRFVLSDGHSVYLYLEAPTREQRDVIVQTARLFNGLGTDEAGKKIFGDVEKQRAWLGARGRTEMLPPGRRAKNAILAVVSQQRMNKLANLTKSSTSALAAAAKASGGGVVDFPKEAAVSTSTNGSINTASASAEKKEDEGGRETPDLGSLFMSTPKVDLDARTGFLLASTSRLSSNASNATE